MKEQTFIVTLEISEKVERDGDLLEISRNIGNAILKEVEEVGITPDDSDSIVCGIKVKPMYLGLSVRTMGIEYGSKDD